VPGRSEPRHAETLTDAIDVRKLFETELDLALVIDVRDAPPRRVTHHVPLIERHAQLRRTLLKLHCVATGVDRSFDELFADLQRTVVVDTDLRNHVHGLAPAYGAATDVDHGPSRSCRRASFARGRPPGA